MNIPKEMDTLQFTHSGSYLANQLKSILLAIQSHFILYVKVYVLMLTIMPYAVALVSFNH